MVELLQGNTSEGSQQDKGNCMGKEAQAIPTIMSLWYLLVSAQVFLTVKHAEGSVIVWGCSADDLFKSRYHHSLFCA